MNWRIVGFAAVLALALGLAGCRPYRLTGDPLSALTPLPPAAPYQVEWWTPLVRSPFLEFFPYETAAPAFDKRRNQVIASTRDGKVTAVSEGRVVWSVTVGGRSLAGPTVVGDMVYVPAPHGLLLALASSDGTEKWRYAAAAELVTPPTVTPTLVLVQTQTDVLIAVDRATGAWRWQYRREPPAGFSIRGAATPAVDKENAYAGFSDGFIVALRLSDGTVRWERGLSPKGTQFIDADASPVLDENGSLFVASYSEGVHALEASSGAIRWKHVATGVTQLLHRGGIVWASGDAQIMALETERGHPAWNLDLKEQAAGKPVLANRYLIVPAGQKLWFIDAAEGFKQMTWDPGRGVGASATWTGERLLVLSNLGVLYALHVRTVPRSL
ncbi:MAG: PQQ-binding-like beta-propeller repeat protein [Myxococcaceae bacterium]